MPPFFTPRQLECSVQLQECSCTMHTLLSKGKQVCECHQKTVFSPSLQVLLQPISKAKRSETLALDSESYFSYPILS